MKEQENRGAPEDTAEDADPASVVASVTEERDRLAREKEELHDRFLRSQAEFQNFRRRVEREKAELLEYASTEAVRALLPVIDDLERALIAETADREYAKGMEMIHQRLFETLKKLGLEPIVSVGRPFDPHFHHAIEMFPTADAADHTILEEFQRGYNFKGRLLRPAMVKVAVEPPAK